MGMSTKMVSISINWNVYPLQSQNKDKEERRDNTADNGTLIAGRCAEGVSVRFGFDMSRRSDAGWKSGCYELGRMGDRGRFRKFPADVFCHDT
jgi:hypothetical protein